MQPWKTFDFHWDLLIMKLDFFKGTSCDDAAKQKSRWTLEILLEFSALLNSLQLPALSQALGENQVRYTLAHMIELISTKLPGS